jgi:molecular chaperone GrpE
MAIIGYFRFFYGQRKCQIVPLAQLASILSMAKGLNTRQMTDNNEPIMEEQSAMEAPEDGLNAPSDKDYDAEIAMLNKQIEELKDKYLRLFADFDNHKKRSVRERQEWAASAGKDIVTAILPVIDDMERALKATNENTDVNAMREGLALVFTKFTNIMDQKGLKSLSSIGEPFDVEKHEAITEIPAPSEDMKGKVIDEVEKGYTLNDKVIRYAKVVVGKRD